MKTGLFQSCGHCWVFQICWHIESSTFTASSFRIWNSSTGIPTPPLGLFVVMLPKAHLTLDSRMSGSRWVLTPSWLSGSWRSFLCSSSVYSCHLFLVSLASVRSTPFLSFIVLTFAWNTLFTSMLIFTHSSVLAWRIPGTGEPGGLLSVGSLSRTRLKWLSNSNANLLLVPSVSYGFSFIYLVCLQLKVQWLLISELYKLKYL